MSGLIKRPCRIYAPVGGHEDLLAYLVRRLLENGANTSFVNRLADDEAPVRRSSAIRSALAEAERGSTAEPPRAFARPRDDLSSRARRGERHGADRAIGAAWRCSREMGDALDDVFEAGPIIGGKAMHGRRRRQPRHLSARSPRAHRHGARHDAGAGRSAPSSARPRQLTTGTSRAAPAARRCSSRGRPLRARQGAPHGGHRARSRQDAGRRAGRRARGHRLPALLCGAGARASSSGRCSFPARPASATR